MKDQMKATPSWAYFLGGAAAGVILGALFAPKKGSELRADVKDWTERRAEEARKLLARVRRGTPVAVAHAKERAQEAIAAVKERVHLSKT